MAATLTDRFFYHLIVNNIAPIMASSITSMAGSYFSGRNVTPNPITTIAETNDERELDLLQMDRMLTWMNLVFDDSFTPVTPGDREETHRSYKKELYNIYRTICSDYAQYRQWKQYNNGIWLLSSYRSKDTKALAKKILADVKLFHEGLKMFSMFDKLQN
jgi:hypothetical protein